MKRQLITLDEAVPAKVQHTKPCSDCPFARTALKGWLGGSPADDWIAEAHGDGPIPCHVLSGAQCAGAAIYRRNVVKTPRDPNALRLEADRDLVFASPVEFKQHHIRKAGSSEACCLTELKPGCAKGTPKSKGRSLVMAKTFTTDEVNMKVANACAKHIKAAERTAAKHSKEVSKLKKAIEDCAGHCTKIEGCCDGNKKVLAITAKAKSVAGKHVVLSAKPA